MHLHNSIDISEIASCSKCKKMNSDLIDTAKKKERRRKPKVPRFVNGHDRENFFFKSNKNKSDLITDSTEFKFTCRVCGKIFLFKYSLKVHLYLHIGDEAT